MAKMYPKQLPESVIQNPKRAAEQRVYQALNDLDDRFLVLYSVGWQARIRDSEAKDGEADFVIAHPDLGVLVMEVKGGGIAYNAQTDEWSSRDRNGEVHPIKNPIKQARANRYALFHKLCDMPGWDRNRWLTIGQVVAFPDVSTEDQSLRLDMPREIIFDHRDLQDIEDAVQRSFKHYAAQDGREGKLGCDRLEIVEDLLASSIQLRTPLGVELEREDEQLITLTERQLLLLDYLSTRRRAAIKGCAGSGKTMLAIEKARRLTKQGFDVLLTCYNQPLAKYLEQRVSDNIYVMHFHRLCKTMAREAEVVIGGMENYPDALLEAIDKVGPRFDAVVVDESQDFEETWWLPLISLLRDPDAGICYVFFDDNQNLYQGQDIIPGVVDEAPFPLTENCRNTQRIHQVVSSFYHASDSLRCPGPNGRPVEQYSYRGDHHQTRILGKLLHKLVVDEKISIEDIVLLTPRSQGRSLLKEGTKLGRFILTTNYPPPPNHIQVSSVHRFKGLERRVVILAEIDRVASPQLDKVLYVGCSRARTHLLLLMDANAPQSVKKRVSQAIK
jgi:hypothetical protein